MAILQLQTRLRTVFLKKSQLLGIDGSATFSKENKKEQKLQIFPKTYACNRRRV